MANNYKISLDAEIRNLKDITSQVQNVGKNLKVKIDVDSGNITKKTEKINKDLYTTITLTETLNKKTGEIATTQEVNYNHTKKLNDELKNRANLEKKVGEESKKANKDNIFSLQNIQKEMKIAMMRTLEWSTTMGLLYGTLHKFRDAVDIVIAMDNQMTNIKMVTGGTNEEMKGLLKTYQEIAKATSSTTSEVAVAGETFARQGKTISETNDLIKTSSVFSKVAFLDSAQASELLTASMNGYGVEASNTMSIVDKLSAVDVAAATGADELAKAMSKTANSAKLAGVDMDDLVGYIATVSDVTRDSAESIGNSFKTIFSRMQSVKLGSLFDEEGESVSNVESVMAQYGITLRSSQGVFKDTSGVLKELNGKWATLTNAQKSEISTVVAGFLKVL